MNQKLTGPCSKCGVYKTTPCDRIGFSGWHHGPFGSKWRNKILCNDCYMDVYYKKHKYEIITQHKQYYIENREIVKARCREYKMRVASCN